MSKIIIKNLKKSFGDNKVINNFTLNIEDESNVQAHFIQSSDLNLVINEINYKSSDDFDPGDWIEIYNPNESSINLSNWVLKDDNDSNTFVFPEGLTIEAEGFIVVVRKFDDFEESFPEIENFTVLNFSSEIVETLSIV